MKRLGLLSLSLAVLVTACSSGDPTASEEYQALDHQLTDAETLLAAVITERDAMAAEAQTAVDRRERVLANQELVYAIIQDPQSYGTETEVLDLLDTFAIPNAMTGDMSWGDGLGPWWRSGWRNTLFGGADATIRTWDHWVSDDGATGGSLWTWAGTAENGEPFSVPGVELSRYNDDGLVTELVMFYPYEAEEVRRRFAEGN